MLQYINYESSVYHHNYVETALPWWAPFPALSGTSHSQCWTEVNSHAPETPKLIFPIRNTGTLVQETQHTVLVNAGKHWRWETNIPVTNKYEQ